MLSTSEVYDRNKKFEHFRTIESFQEYVLIDQSRPHVEHYEKQAESQWLFTEYSGLEASFTLLSVGVEIVLVALYEAVEFESVQ